MHKAKNQCFSAAASHIATETNDTTHTACLCENIGLTPIPGIPIRHGTTYTACWKQRQQPGNGLCLPQPVQHLNQTLGRHQVVARKPTAINPSGPLEYRNKHTVEHPLYHRILVQGLVFPAATGHQQLLRDKIVALVHHAPQHGIHGCAIQGLPGRLGLLEVGGC